MNANVVKRLDGRIKNFEELVRDGNMSWAKDEAVALVEDLLAISNDPENPIDDVYAAKTTIQTLFSKSEREYRASLES